MSKSPEKTKEFLTDEFLDELFHDIPRPIEPGEITIRMVSSRYGCTEGTARGWIEKKVAEGVLESIGKRLVKGRTSQAWRKMKKK